MILSATTFDFVAFLISLSLSSELTLPAVSSMTPLAAERPLMT